MAIRIIRKSELAGTPRHIKNDVYETTRFLLAPDDTGVTVTDITLAAKVEADYGYDANIEIAYCIEGRATLTDLENMKAHLIEPGTMWVAEKKSRFRFVAEIPTRLICVFNPAFSGTETGFAKDQ
jgi:L-ectoine synthase